MFGWIDTHNDNLPEFLDYEFGMILFRLIETVAPSIIKLFFLEGISKRLGKEIHNIKELWNELYDRDLTVYDLLVMVE